MRNHETMTLLHAWEDADLGRMGLDPNGKPVLVPTILCSRCGEHLRRGNTWSKCKGPSPDASPATGDTSTD